MTELAPDVSALVVNYNSAAYCLQCVESLLAQRFTVDGRPGRLEVIVLDNDSRPEDQAALRAVERPGVELIYTGENLGYGPANNRGAARARGRWLWVSNPDVVVFPGALDAMLRVLEARPDCAAVGPTTWMDDDRTLLHPPNDRPSLRRRTLLANANRSVPHARLSARIRTRRAVRHWRYAEPTPVLLLSGANFVTPRAVVDELGLFDEVFPLYYEDTDWFTRARQAGYRLLQVPDAEIVHYFSRSALQDYAAAMEKAQRAEALFYAKHFGDDAVERIDALNAEVKAAIEANPGGIALGPSEDLGPLAAPPTFAVPADHAGRPVLGEIAGNPLFSLAAGTFVAGDAWTLSTSMWNQLWDGIYYCRLVDPDSLDTLGSWRFAKRSAPDQHVSDAL